MFADGIVEKNMEYRKNTCTQQPSLKFRLESVLNSKILVTRKKPKFSKIIVCGEWDDALMHFSVLVIGNLALKINEK